MSDAHIVAAVDRALAGSGHVARRISTHVDRSGPVAVTAVAVDVVPDPAPAVLDALAAALGRPAVERSTGRVVRFPGQEFATGDHTIADLLTHTGIDEIVGVGRMITPEDIVATAGFLRPQLDAGRLVLLVEPTAGGRLRPVEVESPHQCCGGRHD